MIITDLENDITTLSSCFTLSSIPYEIVIDKDGATLYRRNKVILKGSASEVELFLLDEWNSFLEAELHIIANRKIQLVNEGGCKYPFPGLDTLMKE